MDIHHIASQRIPFERASPRAKRSFPTANGIPAELTDSIGSSVKLSQGQKIQALNSHLKQD